MNGYIGWRELCIASHPCIKSTNLASSLLSTDLREEDKAEPREEEVPEEMRSSCLKLYHEECDE